MELSAAEIRVLGCLVEKQLTTPQAYPLTESALITACNQSTNRDPVVAYDQTTVRRALLGLRQHGLAKMIHRPGDRVEKHRHLLDEALSLSAGEVAVLTVLALRGPQTVGELRTRTERMHAFSDIAGVEQALGALAESAPAALVERMPRQPGHSQARFRHLLGGADEEPDALPASASAEPPAVAPAVARPSPDASASEADGMAGVRAEVAALRDRVARLERELGLDESV